MKKIIFAFIAFVVFGSCQSKIEKAELKKNQDIETIKTNIFTKLNILAKDDPDGIVIDSVKLIRVDTLTEKLDSANVVFAYYNKLDKIMYHIKLSNELAKNKLRMTKLYRDLDIDHTSTQEDVKNSLNKAKQMSDIYKNTLDHAEAVSKLINSGKLDSIKTTGFIGVVNVFARDKSMTNRNIDSAKFLLDTNFLINNKLAEIREFDPKK